MCIPNKTSYVCGHHITSYSANSTECNYKIHTEAVAKMTYRWPDSICPECCLRPFCSVSKRPEIVEWLEGVLSQEELRRQREEEEERRRRRRRRSSSSSSRGSSSRGASNAVAATTTSQRQARGNRSASKEGKKRYERGNVFERAGG